MLIAMLNLKKIKAGYICNFNYEKQNKNSP